MPYTALADQLLHTSTEELTTDQATALRRLADYLSEPSPYALFLLRGYAGTGKTFSSGSSVEECWSIMPDWLDSLTLAA